MKKKTYSQEKKVIYESYYSTRTYYKRKFINFSLWTNLTFAKFEVKTYELLVKNY